MRESQDITKELTRHFFRRFFENDVIQSDGDTVTTVVRALSIVMAPSLMFAFFLSNPYDRRSMWGRIEDEYFFVLFSFIVMAGAAVFEWEMLFPDRLDFQVLTPLSIRPGQMLVAKSLALGGFLGLFLLGANVFGMLVLPLRVGTDFWLNMGAHTLVVLMAGSFAALLVVGVGGLLLCVLPERKFRMVSPLLQMICVTVLGLMLVQYARFGDSIETMLSVPLGYAKWYPPYWFLALYQKMLHPSSAPAFAQELWRNALWAAGAAAMLAFTTYPLAWTKMRRMAVEGEVSRGRPRAGWWRGALHLVVRKPVERAIFHFIGQTILRNSRYQVYLAMYSGTGLALAISCATTFRMVHGRSVPALTNYGLHAVMPLLIFWVVTGLSMAFGFPLDLAARWIFRTTGADLQQCMAAARKWVLCCSVSVLAVILAGLCGAGWSVRLLLVQAICGACLCVLLVEGFFFAQSTVPFSRPRTPGKTSLPLILTLYIGVLTPFVFGMIRLELLLERHIVALVLPLLAIPLFRYVAYVLRERAVLIEEEREGGTGEYQLLGLAGDLTA